jgi:hypothetical protein
MSENEEFENAYLYPVIRIPLELAPEHQERYEEVCEKRTQALLRRREQAATPGLLERNSRPGGDLYLAMFDTTLPIFSSLGGGAYRRGRTDGSSS